MSALPRPIPNLHESSKFLLDGFPRHLSAVPIALIFPHIDVALDGFEIQRFNPCLLPQEFFQVVDVRAFPNERGLSLVKLVLVVGIAYLTQFGEGATVVLWLLREFPP